MPGVAPPALGRLGEEWARLHLEACGFRPVACRHRTRYGEIDLVARRDDLLVFVEVKTRRGDACGRPEEAVTRAKLARLRRLAAAFLAEVGGGGCCRFRFDVVAVTFGGEGRGCRLEHFAGVR
ncbi:MAG: YraN family protein [Candidatus Krumholzibacteriia bacterium]